MTQAAAPPPHLALTGANPSPPGQPQEQTPVDNPHVEVEIKPQLKLRGSVARKKTQNLPTSCTSCRLHPHNQLGRLCVYGIYKRTLKVKVKSFSLVRLFATPWTVAYESPPSMEFFSHENWSGFPFPSPGDLPNPGIELMFPLSLALADRIFTTVPPGKP